MQSERETIAKRRKIRTLSTVLDWKRATVDFDDETGDWFARPVAIVSHDTIRKAKRQVHKSRKDGFIEFSERETVALKVIRHALRKIATRNNLSLSETDKKDGEASGMLALVQTGFFRHGRLPLSTFKAIRNAIQGPDCLRIRRTWETASGDIADTAAKVGFITTDKESPRLTRRQIGNAKEVMRTLRATRDFDKSRKAVAAFKSQRDFFLIVLGDMTGRGSRSMNRGTFDTRKSRFLDYLAIGAAKLRANQNPPNLAREIMRELSARAFA